MTKSMIHGFRFGWVMLAIIAVLAVISAAPATAGENVYLLYSMKDAKDFEAVTKGLPKAVTQANYKVDVLAIADYSGKQKAVGKVETAEVVVVIGDAAVEILKGIKFKKPVVLVRSVKAGKEGIDSEKYLVVLAPKGSEGKVKGKALDIAKDVKAGELSGVYVVAADEKEIPAAAISLLTKLFQ